jgi:4'-phosphopantetheinyl transferase
MLSTANREHHTQRWLRAQVNATHSPILCDAMATLPLRSPALGRPTLIWPKARNVHVWRLDLRDMGADATGLLDRAETERAQRFVYAHDWRRYVAAHAWLRRILAGYMGVPPQQLRFAAGAYGKPVLLQAPRGPGQPQLCFNLSHSKDLALVAVTSGIEVGVDIEAIREDLPGPDLAAGVLSSAELDELAQCAASDHAHSFVGCWVRKEACLKAVGIGLGLDPREINVGLRSERHTVLVDGATAPIAVASLPTSSGYRAALAVVGGFAKIEPQGTANQGER